MIYFILGILFAAAFLPVLDSIIELIQLTIEKQKSKLAFDITKINKETSDLTNPKNDEDEHHTIIGFAASDIEELGYEDEEDEEFEEDDDI